MIRFGREVCSDLEEALAREWLETNGIGGFASSTIVGLNTRRYHGLLVAATHPPVGRMVLLSKLEETLILKIGGRDFPLSPPHNRARQLQLELGPLIAFRDYHGLTLPAYCPVPELAASSRPWSACY